MSFIWFGMMFFMFLFYIKNNISGLLDSDMSSEMILAEQLAKEGKIMSDQWYYSTEIRVLSTQLIFTPLFQIFGAGYSWHKIRVLGTILCVIVLMISFYLLCRVLKIRNIPYYAAFLLLPVSYEYFFFMFCNLLYLPYVVITFLTLGIVLDGTRRSFKNRRTAIELLLLFGLSVGAGAGGFRELLVCYLPLFLAGCILLWAEKVNEKHKWCIWIGTAFLGACMGLIINITILSQKYSFWDFTGIIVQGFSFSKLEQAVNAMLVNMGFQSYVELMSPEVLFKEVFFCGWFLLVCCAVVNILKKKEIYTLEERFVTIFSLCNAVLMLGIYSFTDMKFEIRYFTLVTFMAIPLVAIYLNKRKRNLVYDGILIGLVIGSLGISASYYENNTVNWAHPNEEFSEISRLIVNYGYQNGYAGYWQANVLTEISDGKIEVWDYGDTSEGLQIEKMNQWLQLKSHVEQPPTGKVFVLLTSEQSKNTKWKVKPEDSRIIYQSDDFILYGFDSYEDIKANLKRSKKNIL